MKDIPGKFGKQENTEDQDKPGKWVFRKGTGRN
jgi:hypothetical protein